MHRKRVGEMKIHMKKKKTRGKRHWGRRRMRRTALTFGMFIACISLLLSCWVRGPWKGWKKDGDKSRITKMYTADKKTKPSTHNTEISERPSATPAVSVNPVNKTDRLYSYLQGPWSWHHRLEWSGEWGDTFMDGSSFGGFGCGICCMANIYSSLTEYQCSPLDMYRYTKRHTGYSGGMAVEWGYMRRGLSSLGFKCHVERKHESYRKFQKKIKKSKAAIVLVSSTDSRIYWKNTPGHYVTIFEYDQQTDKVFLADSGDPKHNRHWISLRKIYRSLKSASNWQCLLVEDHNAKKDTWKHKKTTGRWNRPKYLKK